MRASICLWLGRWYRNVGISGFLVILAVVEDDLLLFLHESVDLNEIVGEILETLWS
ncbi:hypothetical protein D3C86_2061130 [compost metagenome]